MLWLTKSGTENYVFYISARLLNLPPKIMKTVTPRLTLGLTILYLIDGIDMTATGIHQPSISPMCNIHDN